MGQTLTHGVYLPDEGERNCYNGLASNWTILDGAVGTVAEHTSALSGKAPLVHTHSKSDITDFPAYGNAAGTICEGNDARLSDARTPVAHTHTKSDVTDLLNSDFIPSANNAYDLGSSSYQWKSVYAQNYYYKGVAWGLDKLNTWSAVNQYSREIQLAGDRNAFIAPMWEGAGSGIAFLVSDASKAICFGNYINDVNNDNRKIVDASTGRIVIRVGSKDNETYTEIEPRGSNNRLGNSTYKWKTLNGINPGALSLPDTLGTSGTENVNYFNVIGYLNNTGTLATIPSAATYDGWLYINAKDGADSYIIIDDSPASFGTSVFGNNGLGSQSIGLLCLMCPIRKGHAYNVRIKSAGIVSARIYPAQGNV